MIRFTVLAAVLALASAACTSPGQQGDDCTQSNMCGAGLICDRCNVDRDSGPDDSGATPYAPCARPCTTDSDCAGSSDVHFGPTPRCISNTCGQHVCGPNI